MAVSVAGLTTVVVSFMKVPRSLAGRRSLSPTGACRLDQGLEQPTVPGLLRMPLDTDHEPVAGQLDRLDDAVTAPGRHHQVASQVADGLMVAAQHLQPLTEETADGAPRFGDHSDSSERAGARLVVVRPHQVGELLDQVAAQVDVEDLNAATHRQYG